MSKLVQGQIAPDFTFRTPWLENQKFSEWVAKAPKTILIFSRYYGCSLCQLDIAEMAEAYPKFAAKGVQVLIALQSAPETMQAELNEDSLPFPIILDPEQTIYHLYDLNVAEDLKKAVSLKTLSRLAKAKSRGFQHGKYEGEENQLQAALILDRNRQVLFVKYAESLADIPDAEELLALL
ncbi:MAG: redoxin domain-containing protein [Negativicutes bacterium]|nr:redoxin domain-containing protein [Negativicutes bacterium]